VRKEFAVLVRMMPLAIMVPIQVRHPHSSSGSDKRLPPLLQAVENMNPHQDVWSLRTF